MKNRKILIITLIVGAIIVVSMGGKLFETNQAGFYQVKQQFYFGDLTVQDCSYLFDDLDVEWDGEIPQDEYEEDVSFYDITEKYEKIVKQNDDDYFLWSER